MPVYNRQNYIKSSLESILNQTYKDFDFIIIDDGSTDRTVEIIEGYNDSRIKLIRNEKNRGIVYSRNRGLKHAKGKYIGMFDSDDIALPTKFEKQINFLEKNLDYGMVGSWVKWIDENGNLKEKGWKLPAPANEIPAIMLFRNYFVQSTVVIRKNVIPEGGYSQGFDVVEDSKMWFDVSLSHKVWNLQEYLLHYRVHSGNISTLGESAVGNSNKLTEYKFLKLNIEPTEQETENHLLLRNSNRIESLKQLKEIENWLLKIYLNNKKQQLYDRKILKKILFNRWLKACYKARSLHFKMILVLLKSKLSWFFV